MGAINSAHMSTPTPRAHLAPWRWSSSSLLDRHLGPGVDTSAPSARDPGRAGRRDAGLCLYKPAQRAVSVEQAGLSGAETRAGGRPARRTSTTMPSPLQNGARAHHHQQQGGKAGRRSRAVVALLLFRAAALCFSVAAAVSAATDGGALRRAPFRFLLAANAIVAVYSAFECAAAAWEVARGATLLPEALQLWFDFGHDQGFGYMALAAAVAAARDAASCGGRREQWGGSSSRCLQADVAVGLGFAGFAFLAVAALVTGFRLACFLVTGSRSAPPPSDSGY